MVPGHLGMSQYSLSLGSPRGHVEPPPAPLHGAAGRGGARPGHMPSQRRLPRARGTAGRA
eukprot:256608-Prymnesium_polylepis.1